MNRSIAILLVAWAAAACGNVKGEGNDTDTDGADAPEIDVPAEPDAGDVPDDAVPDPDAGDPPGDEGGGGCVPGPPTTFADGVTWSRDLHVGASHEYATLSAAAAAAGPGDRIVVHSGSYAGEYVSGLQGTASQPIGIVAASGETPPVFGSSGTGLQLSDPVYVLVEGIVVDDCTDNGMNIDDGGDYSTPAGPIVIRNVTIRDVGPSGNHDGLKMSGVDDFVVYGNTIETWGDGGSGIDMVGCHDGLIVGNTLRHTASLSDANGVQAKGGCRNVEIRGNLFENPGSRGVNMGGSTGDDYFRPLGIGYEASEIVVIANVFVGSGAPAAFVGCEGGCLFGHNTIYRPETWVVRILNERPDLVAETRDGRFLYNIVVVDSALRTFINVGPDTDPSTFTFDGNLWYHLDDSSFTMGDIPNDAGLTITQTNALVQQDPLFGDASSGNFTLGTGSPAVGQAGALAERELDFEEKCYADPAALGAIEQE